MESSLTVPRVGVGVDDLPDAAALFESEGPFVSVMLDTELAVENAPTRFERRWKEHRRTLHDRGTPEALLDRIGEWLRDARTEGNALACIAAADGTMVTAVGEHVGADVAAWDSLPRLCPLIHWHQSNPPALLVLIDRTGADIFTGGRQRRLLGVVTGDVGPDIRKSPRGDWKQPHYDAQAQERWRANTAEVAEQVVGLVERLDPRIVVVAGDLKAVEMMVDQLPPRIRSLTRRVTGGRGKGSEGSVEEGSSRLYRSAIAEDTVELVAKLKEELGQRDRGVAGIADVAAALRSAAVDTLLVNDDRLSGRRMFYRASDRLSIAARESDLEGLDLRDGRMVDVMIRAAWASGAQVRMTPKVPEMADGVAALLRFPRAPGTA